MHDGRLVGVQFAVDEGQFIKIGPLAPAESRELVAALECLDELDHREFTFASNHIVVVGVLLHPFGIDGDVHAADDDDRLGPERLEAASDLGVDVDVARAHGQADDVRRDLDELLIEFVPV